MAALPGNLTKANFDSSLDDPSQAQSEFAGNVDKVNTIISYLTGLFGSDGVKATARTTLGLGDIATQNVSDGLEIVTTTVRVKLDGTTLTRAAAGLKVSSKAIAINEIADQARGSIITFGASNVAKILAPGTSGDFLQSAGPAADLVYAAASSAGRLIGVQVITATQTYNAGAGTNSIVCQLVAGGASGGAGNDDCGAQSGGGGGAGGAAIERLTSAFDGLTATIGAGGAAQTTIGNTGNSGTTTSLGGVLSATGGTGGAGGGGGGGSDGLGGVGGVGSGGDINLTGGRGEDGGITGGRGGNGPGPHGGQGGVGSGTGPTHDALAGTDYGSGGGGGRTDTGTDMHSAAGAPGVMVIWEYS